MSLQNGTFKKAYFEITNVCNAACSFCPKNSREPHFVTDSEFDNTLAKLKGRAEYLYFHLMGEPLLHPKVCDLAVRANECGFKVMITSNGILSEKVGIPLVKTGALTKISLSLHSYEANAFGISLSDYLDRCFALAEAASENGCVCALRLWNRGAKNDLNSAINDAISARFGTKMTPIRTGYKVADNIFIEEGDRFEWPDGESENDDVVFCHALRNQIGILCDGTVVPCCLDSEGRMPLGNIYDSTLDEILVSPRAKELYDGFSGHKAVEKMCRSCGYANRFTK